MKKKRKETRDGPPINNTVCLAHASKRHQERIIMKEEFVSVPCPLCPEWALHKHICTPISVSQECKRRVASKYGSGWKTANASGTILRVRYVTCCCWWATHSLTHHFVRALAINQSNWTLYLFIFFIKFWHFTLLYPICLSGGVPVPYLVQTTPVVAKNSFDKGGFWKWESKAEVLFTALVIKNLRNVVLEFPPPTQLHEYLFLRSREKESTSTSLFLLYFAFLFLSFYLFLCF